MPDPVNAADVLADAVVTLANDDPDIDEWQVKSLLAHAAGDPVVITDDGRLGRKTCGCPVADPVQP